MQTLNCEIAQKYKFKPSSYNILIIEDSKSVNKILFTTFTKLGYNCFSAFTLADGKKTLENNEIHYIMLDINLPDGNGYELVKTLENTPEKIFVITSETDKQFRDTVYQKGVIDFIVKDKDFIYKIEKISITIERIEKNRLKTILIIDDSLVLQDQLKDLLTNRNYNIKLASDSKKALKIITSKTIDLILLDVELKNENGIEFLVKNKDLIININKIPVMILTNNIETTMVRDGLKAGAISIIRKPYITEEVILKVDLWIDYKRKADEVLSANKLLEEYKDAVDESSMVSKANSNGIITYVNKNFCSLSGYTHEELIGKNHNIVRHPDMQKEIFKDLWYTIKVLKQTWKGQIKNRKKDGGYYWVDSLIKPILDTDGNIVEFIGLRTDITDTVNLKDELKEQYSITSDKYDDIVSLSKLYEEAIDESSIILRMDLNHVITYCNEQFCEVSGYTKKELIGKPHSILIHPNSDNKEIHKIWDFADKGEIWKGKVKNISKSGLPFYSLSTLVPLKNKEGEIIEYMAIRKDITELINLHEEIEKTQKEIIYKMGEIGESRSKETGNHVKRVSLYSKELALLYGISEENADILMIASPMHDIGKVGIPDDILNKPGKLTPEEFEIMKTHSTLGYEMLKGSTKNIIKTSSIVAYEHHEKWNGTGYPRGLQGEEIHIYGRITAIADVFDALGSDRCYKKAWKLDDILDLFKKQKGKHFDPHLIELFLNNLDTFLEIRDRYVD